MSPCVRRGCFCGSNLPFLVPNWNMDHSNSRCTRWKHVSIMMSEIQVRLVAFWSSSQNNTFLYLSLTVIDWLKKKETERTTFNIAKPLYERGPRFHSFIIFFAASNAGHCLLLYYLSAFDFGRSLYRRLPLRAFTLSHPLPQWQRHHQQMIYWMTLLSWVGKGL